MYKIDQNVIVVRNNSISVMRLTQDDIEPVVEIPIFEQIVAVIKVPTEAFVKEPAAVA